MAADGASWCRGWMAAHVQLMLLPSMWGGAFALVIALPSYWGDVAYTNHMPVRADNNMTLYSLLKITVLCALFYEAAAAVRHQPIALRPLAPVASIASPSPLLLSLSLHYRV